MNLTLTNEQRKALDRIHERWSIVHEPQPMFGENAIVVPVGGTKEQPSMYLAVETDGYTHS